MTNSNGYLAMVEGLLMPVELTQKGAELHSEHALNIQDLTFQVGLLESLCHAKNLKVEDACLKEKRTVFNAP